MNGYYNLCFLNDKFRTLAAGVLNDATVSLLPLVSDLRQGKKMGYILSVSALVRTQDNKYIVIERDEAAPTDPLKSHFPAGRVDFINIEEAVLSEISEEVEVIDNNSKTEPQWTVLKSSLKSDDFMTLVVDNEVVGEYRTTICLDQPNKTIELVCGFELPNASTNYSLADKEYGRKVTFEFLSDLKYIPLTDSMQPILKRLYKYYE